LPATPPLQEGSFRDYHAFFSYKESLSKRTKTHHIKTSLKNLKKFKKNAVGGLPRDKK
jgi:hypothetical protein